MAENTDNQVEGLLGKTTPQEVPETDLNQPTELDTLLGRMPSASEPDKPPTTHLWDGFTDKERRERRTGASGYYDNAIDDISNAVTGTVAMAKMIGGGTWDFLAGNLSLEDAADSIEEFQEQFIKGFADSFIKWEDPGKALYNYPVESILDLVGAMSIIGSLGKTTVNTAAKAGIKTSTNLKSMKLLSQVDDAFKLNGKLKKAVTAGGEVDLGRISDLLQNPTTLLKEVVATPLRPALKTELGKKVVDFSGLSKRAQHVDDLMAKRQRLAQQEQIKIVDRALKPHQALKLTPEESKLAYFKTIGLDKLAKMGPALKASTATADRSLVDALIKTSEGIADSYKDILAIESKLAPERLQAVNKSVDIVAEEITKIQESNLILRGQLAADRAKNSALSFIIAEADNVHGGDFVKAYSKAIGDENLSKQAVLNKMANILKDINVKPNYLPTELALRKSRAMQFVDRAIEKVFKRRGTGADPDRLHQKKIRRFRELLDRKDKKTGRSIFNTDIDSALLTASSTYVQLRTMSKTIDDLIKHPDVKLVRQGEKLNPDEVYIFPNQMKTYLRHQEVAQKSILQKLASEGFDEFSADSFNAVWGNVVDDMLTMPMELIEEMLAKKKMDLYKVPRDMAISLQRHTAGMPQILSLLNVPQGVWKAITLLGSPRWYLQNLIGNTVLNIVAAGPLNYAMAMLPNVKRKLDRLIPDEINSDFTSAFTQFERLRKVKGMNKFQRAMRHLTLQSTFQKAGDYGGAIANSIESLTRRQAFRSLALKRIREMKKGGIALGISSSKLEEALADPTVNAKLATDALESVEEALFNYHKMHPWERKYVRTIFPFWAWTRNINLLMGKMIKAGLDKPLKTFAYHRLAKISYDMMNDPDQPRWMDGKIWTGFGDITGEGGLIFIDLRAHNPFSSLNQFALHPSNLSPIIKVVVEQIGGRNVFTQRPFKSGEISLMATGKLLRYNQETGGFTDKPFVPPLHLHAMKQFAHYNWLNDLINNFAQTDDGSLFDPSPIRDVDGRPRFEREQLFTLSKIFGLPLMRVTEKGLREEKQRKVALQQRLVKKLKASLRYRPRDEHAGILKAIRDVMEDKRSFVEFD